MFFTKLALKKSNSIKDHITEEWAQRWPKYSIKRHHLEIFPEIGTEEVKEKQIGSFLLTKQTHVFYRIRETELSY